MTQVKILCKETVICFTLGNTFQPISLPFINAWIQFIFKTKDNILWDFIKTGRRKFQR